MWLDVDSLFKNITLDETIDIYVNNMYNDNENPPKHNFRDLVNIATKKSIFTFINKYYKQVYDGAIGFPLDVMLMR